jgi:hypothetical protein
VWKLVDAKLKAFEQGAVKGIETVALDSLTSMQEAMETRAQVVNGRLGEPTSLLEYGLVISYINDLMYRIVSLRAKGYHVVVTAHEQLEKDETLGKLIARPLVVGKKLPDRLPVWFDEVYYAYTEIGKDGLPIYKLRLCPDALHFAKSRLKLVATAPDFAGLYRQLTDGLVQQEGKDAQ